MAVNAEPYIHELIICVGVIIRKDDKFLVMKRSPLKKYAPGIIHPIGGKVEKDEDPFTAAEREVLEETGLTVRNFRLKAVFLELQPILNEPFNWVIYHFLADYNGGEIHETEEGQLKWLTRNEIIASELFPTVRETIGHLLNPEEGTLFGTFDYDAEKIKVVKKTINIINR